MAQTPPNQTARIVGIDLSLAATGICDEQGPRVYKSKKRGMDRLCDIRIAIARSVCAPVASLVVLEGYSYASTNQAHQLGELGGVIRHYLWTQRIPYVDVPPSTLKKFATGAGNANKSAMGLAAARSGYDGPGDDNAIDAWWLHHMGLYATDRDYLEHEGSNRTAYRDEAIFKIDWPAT